MISVSNLAKSFGAQLLFEGAAFQLNPGHRYGLVGANGSGKSTLMRILAGEEIPSDGTVSIPKRLQLGVLRQDHFAFEKEAILDVVLMGNAELWEAMTEKETILAGAEESFDADRYAELEDIVLRHNGYAVESQAAEILEGLGIPAEVHQQPLSTLSGGFKLRVLLAQTLAANPGALLLDEPTNHLDILSIRWLEKFLQEYAGIVLIISHDHRFLDNVCSDILDVDYETVTLYPGNYTDFEQAKRADRERMEKESAKREKEIAHHKAFVDRFRAKATKARQAQSKMRLIEKQQDALEPIPVTSRRYPKFRFHQQRPSGKDALTLKGVSKAFGDNQVLNDVSLVVRRGEHLAIIGPNGIGKSTLLKIAVGDLEADAGKVAWGYETYPGYFAQDHREQLGESRQTVEENLWELCPGETIGFVRGQLAQVLFTKDEVDKKLSSLSGGEAARLVFAKLAVQEPNVLVLDEPTNHLDLEAIEALVEALRAYDGTLIFVSHDRWFVSQLANRIVEITREGLQTFDGNYEEYVAKCGDDHLDAESVALKVRRDKRRKKSAGKKDQGIHSNRREKALIAKRDSVTRTIEEAEARVHEINEVFCDPSYFDRTSPKEVRKLELEQKQLKERIEELMSEWTAVEDELTVLDS
jgi:ATPase subunit of ABC transporter with duplicated ATPase domains